MSLQDSVLFLGVDGGGTNCRARLSDCSGAILGEGLAGPANIRFGLGESFSAVLDATGQSLDAAGRSFDNSEIVACIALAGASEPVDLAAARRLDHPFRRVMFTTDAHAACAGAHEGADGGVIVVGTGAVGWAVVNGHHHRVGGWGFPVSDEGSGAWLGCELVRRVLWAEDGRIAWTGLLREAFEHLRSDPHAIVRWMGTARPRDFGALAPLVVAHAARCDPVGQDLIRAAASHVDALATRLVAFGASRLALAGGLAPAIEPWTAAATTSRLVRPAGDALHGALLLARAEQRSVALAA